MTKLFTVDWWFASRVDGGTVIGQLPNPALAVWLAAVAWRIVADPEGTARSVLDGIATGALLVWAIDEVVRGVNPWRRLLGAVVLVPTALSALARVT
jgi:multisubunit Na+/H+ antiporter MnhE subunit